MSEQSAVAHGGAEEALSWEELGHQSPTGAFLRSLKELLVHPARFFRRMSTTGGLREPLTFYWILLTLMILMSFPLALSHFALTAPDPLEVSTHVYNRHLFVPRVAGFVTVLLPIALVAAAVCETLAGSVFHLGARLFGARRWEGSVSIWFYARSAGAAPALIAEGLALMICLACYLIALLSPGARGGLRSLVEFSIVVLGAAGGVAGGVWTLVALISGCTKAFRLEWARGAASAVAGLVLTAMMPLLPVLGGAVRGTAGALAGLGGDIVLLALLGGLGAAVRRAGRSGQSTSPT